MTDKEKAVIGLIVGIPAIIAFAYFTNIGAAITLFFAMFANNISMAGK